jgi:hypothetical protein
MESGTPSDPTQELWSLRERAKELRCLYAVTAALSRRNEPPQQVFRAILEAIPPAWQYPEDTTARIQYFGRSHALPDFTETSHRLRSTISLWRTDVGAIEVFYKTTQPEAWEGPFLREERELLDNIAHRLGEYLEWKQRELGGERIGAAPEHWRWRESISERIAATIDPGRFGVRSVYLFGSTEAGTAGPGSDIDLMLVFDGDSQQESELRAWLDGWSLCLAEISFQLYGLPSTGLLDAKILSPEQAQVELKSFAAVGNTLRSLPVGSAARSSKSRTP